MKHGYPSFVIKVRRMKYNREEREIIKRLSDQGRISARGARRRICGKLIGQGINRDVYELRGHPSYVVKIQNSLGNDNILEWEIWSAIMNAPEISKWFTRCLLINENGTVLIQKRITHPALKKDYPKKIPKWFSDTKYKNYGFIGDQFVCCDYANVLSMMTGYFNPKELKSVRWWNPHKEKQEIKKYRTDNKILSKDL